MAVSHNFADRENQEENPLLETRSNEPWLLHCCTVILICSKEWEIFRLDNEFSELFPKWILLATFRVKLKCPKSLGKIRNHNILMIWYNVQISFFLIRIRNGFLHSKSLFNSIQSSVVLICLIFTDTLLCCVVY